MALKAEISWDLVMVDDMHAIEGTYRLADGIWCVFMFRTSNSGLEKIGVRKNLEWESGVTGLNVIVPDDVKLNKAMALRAMSDALGVTEWIEVEGPDSMKLR